VRVLIVEDEPKLAGLLRKGLTAQGLAADVASHGDEAMYMATATAYDAITLDVMLPDTDGFTLCREVRMPVLAVGELRLDPAARTVHRGDASIDLTRKEFALLEALMRRPGEAVSRFDLLECAWDDSYDNRSNVVDVYIGYLRQKVDRPFGTDDIETVRGFGYRLRTEEEPV
jgi:two-component system OmpR family response regulator